MALCEKIMIAGFSGAGKTSLLRSLKATAPSDWVHFDDLDQIILQKHGKSFRSLAELIEAKGWENFRLWERQEFEAWIKNEGKGILALGGGTLSPLLFQLYEKSKRLKFLYLSTKFETCLKRLTSDEHEIRPLAQLGESYLRKIFQEREEVFSQIEWKLSGEKPLEENAKIIWTKISGERAPC